MGLNILLVDDEGHIRRLMTRVLERAGHSVIAAEDGDAAREHLSERPEAIDLMVLDIVIPPRGAAEVLDEALGRRPDLPFLLISGEQIGDEIRQRMEAARGSFLRKPFRAEAILEAIDGVSSMAADPG